MGKNKKNKKAVPITKGIVALPGSKNKDLRQERKVLKDARNKAVDEYEEKKKGELKEDFPKMQKRKQGAEPEEEDDVSDSEEEEVVKKKQKTGGDDVEDSEDDSDDDLPAEDETDSRVRGRKVLEQMLHPITIEDFYENYYEKKPLLINRKSPGHFKGWLSKKDIDTILREQELRYTHDIDIAKYENGKRRTLNPNDGRATADEVWDFHEKKGCTLRLLCPNRFCDSLWAKNALLQEYWGCMAGANCYLTPKAAQGFAPHFDDVEVFVLQMEGRKQWRLYGPRTESEVLSRVSSRNFTQEEIGAPILECILEEGDTLYFPRAVIHQAFCMEDTHSLHLTVSTNQTHTWFDYLEKGIPMALTNLTEDNIEYRKSLPRDHLEYMGAGALENKNDKRRQKFKKELMSKVEALVEALPFDDAADEMSKTFMHQLLPPCLTEDEKRYCAGGDKAMRVEDSTEVRLVTRHAARLVVENDLAVLYTSVDNPRAYWTVPPQKIEYDLELAPALEALMNSYPEWITVDTIPVEDEEERTELIQELFDAGIVATR